MSDPCNDVNLQDMDRGTLSFTHNGVDLGVAFDEGLSGELFPAIAFYNRGQEVSLIPSAFDCPGAGVGISTRTLAPARILPVNVVANAVEFNGVAVAEDRSSDSDAEFDVEDIVHVKRILRTSTRLAAMSNGGASGAVSPRYPDFFVRRCWLQYRKWAAGHTFRAKTRLGVCMQFDVSRQRCHAFGFQHGDRVATPRGQATVIGVAKHKLWFQIDGENGAWFFSAKELRSSKRLFVLLSRSKQSPASPKTTKVSATSPDADRVSLTTSGGGGTTPVVASSSPSMSASPALSSSTSSPVESSLLLSTLDGGSGGGAAAAAAPGGVVNETMAAGVSLEAFSRLLHRPFFAPVDDGVLVDLVNDYCARDDSNPWNVPYDVVCGSVSRDFFASCQGRGKKRGALPPSAVPIRLAFLKCLNDLLLRVLPACDVSARNFGPYIDATDPPSAIDNDSSGLGFTSNGVFGADLGHQVCAFRASLFYHTKRDLLRTILDRTATKPKKADDEYDYPEELPQIMLNRPRAAASTQRRDHTARLRHSMFGQLLDALHFLPPRIQRIAYTHPMDDAQQRSFKMKFEGEGVDDYGGPFREVFSQLSAELMTTFGKIGAAGAGSTATAGAGGPSGGLGVAASSSSPAASGRGDDADDEMRREFIAEGHCVLPLLQPTPNKSLGQGLDRESLMLNPRLAHVIAMDRGMWSAAFARRTRSVSASSTDDDSAQAAIAGAAAASTTHNLTYEDARAWHERRWLAQRNAPLYSTFCYFLGQVMGIAIRNRVTFPVRLCALVWKPLVGEPLVAEDLFEADTALKDVLHQIRHDIAPYGDEMLEDADVRWVTRLSDGSEVDLLAVRPTTTDEDSDDDGDGGESFVRASEIDAYEKAVIEVRLNECRASALAVREGLCSIVPPAVIALLHWKELRALVAGREHINIELLRSCTEYDEDVNPDDDYIQYFWAALEEFDNAQRSLFLRFVWARSRLPASKEDFTQKFKIQAASSAGAVANPDKYLPKAHTCFFSLSLPKYSSQAVLAEKLEYAMDNCIEMDADFRLAEHEMTGWDQADVDSHQLF